MGAERALAFRSAARNMARARGEAGSVTGAPRAIFRLEAGILEDPRMASVAIRDVTKAFGTTRVIHGVDIDIEDGEFVVLVGPSGCGKSTLLRMIAGLENITGGEIRIGERVVNNVPPKERDIAMVFQNYALYPHMTVADNMGFSLKLRGAPKAEIDTRVRRAAEILSLTPLLGRFPRQLSGGQRQRVAMGRAIVRDPQVFLFDEPLSNLDAKLRVAMRTEIKELHQRLKTTTVYVTHDQIEAMTMADKIVVMHDGLVEQIGEPLDLYDRPDNLFVAGFIGSPAMNFLKGTIRANGSLVFEGPGGARLPLTGVPAEFNGRAAIYGVRPEHFTLAEDGAEAEIQVIEPTGSETQVFAKFGEQEIVAVFRERHQFAPGEKIRLKPDARLVHLFDEASGQRLNA
jgi:multiple sugar transport system ATP-binding protein